MVWWLVRGFGQSCRSQKGYDYLQKLTLVNIKLKWVKDRTLDEAVAGQRDLKAACTLVSIIFSDSEDCVPIYRLRRQRRQLGIPDELKLSSFVRRYPSIFHESSFLDSGGTPVPLFSLTPEAFSLHQEELRILQQNQMDTVIRLQKLLMLVKDITLPLQTINQLKWDLGLPHDYHQSLIPCFPELFSFVNLKDDRVGLKLLSWDSHLAVSHLQKNNEGASGDCLAFPIGFPRGYGLKRKCMEWLEEWQGLPYTSPYCDPSHLDPRTDISEKRIVGVFHELLHLTILKQTERKNVSNLRSPLRLPQKFTKVFERHPSIFYISKKIDTQTVVLREAYCGSELLEKHPLVEIRRRYAEMMKQGFLDRSRGLYREARDIEQEFE
ncbi:protein ROOT PRIMORDIUM DEFECTIVE 1 [Chenopodium quinoa]|uniref:PORR domain-containing protein n=1 Tax=Chenopodium quinoa TaxID=63459 RepID=A0A803MQ43_CHEQI|nr:protein ROOT PRIMORDIUM DEFECTIVE 1 [Chenopodium quinoa]XP_021764460.1 protein ROOT PRIMORDIUM DEFECTIVE 1 [Chenopodium quinoa]